jgi:hypothetical protein
VRLPHGARRNRNTLNIDKTTLNRRFDRALLLLFLVTLPLVNPWVRGDGVGYYAYARAPLIEHSLNFLHDYQNANEGFREDRLDAQGQPKAMFYTRTGHLENHFTVGPAILWAPFLLAAHVGVSIARAFGSHVAADGFSAPYRYAMALGTAIYGFLGLWLGFRLVRKYVDSTWAFLATLAIWWGSSLPVYMYFNPSWSHAHSAFVVALFLWYWDATRESRSLPQWLLLGVIAGLMLNVYYANLMVMPVLVIEALGGYRDAFRRDPGAPTVSKLLTAQVCFGMTVAVCLLPTFITRYIVYGSPFETGYLSLRSFLWDSPVFLRVLFSSDHGLFSWTPLLLISFLGICILARRTPKIGLPLLVASLCFYGFFSFYPDWDGISSFGNRFFVSLTALFVFGLAVCAERFAAPVKQARVAVAAVSLILLGFVTWNMGLVYQWGTHLIPPRGSISFRQAAYNQFVVVPRKMSGQLRTYLFRRGDLMQQIEKEDTKELKQGAE